MVNGGIRWNSTHDIIERVIQLRDAIELYQVAYRSEFEDNALTNDDWLELREMLALLAPLKRTSLLVQSSFRKGQYNGNLYEALQSIDLLTTKLEARN